MNVSGRVATHLWQLGAEYGETREQRIDRVVERVRGLGGNDLVVLPELWDVGYFAFDRFEAEAEPLDAGPIAVVAEAAREIDAVVVAGSVLERDGSKLHNTVVVIGADGTLLGTYRKQHLFSYRSREAELLTPGRGPVVVDTPVGRLGLATCFDLRFPAHFAQLRDAAADILVVPAAWPRARAEHWRVLVQARAIETQTPIVACNAAGAWDGVDLAGASMVVSARGRVLLELSGSEPDEGDVDIDHGDTRAWRDEFPLRDAVVTAAEPS